MFESLSINDKYEYLIKCSNSYYESGINLIDDLTFDKYVDLYETESKKEFKYLGKSNNKKCKLPTYMGSLSKIKTLDKLLAYNNKYITDNIIISEKLDGCSILIYKLNNIQKLATRGDGTNGSDISHLLPYLTIPINLDNNIIIRGELIMKKDIFLKYYSKIYQNARNLISGLINSKTIEKEILKHCDIVTYSIPNCKKNQIETFTLLKDIGYNIPIYTKLDKQNITFNNILNILTKFKTESIYEIDGIVLTDNLFHSETSGDNPKHTIAFKQNITGIEAIVEDVIWEETRYGLLKPRIQIIPVECGGVTITYLTGFNAKYIVDNGIGINTILIICRSGDVIPYILSVKKGTISKLPLSYEWTDGVDIKILSRQVNTCQQMAHFLTVCGAKGVKEATIQKCIDIGLINLDLLLMCSSEQLLQADGIKDKMSNKILEQFIIVKNNCSLENIMYGSCIFEHFGEKKIKIIINSLPDILDVILKSIKYDTQVWIDNLNKNGIKSQSTLVISQFEIFLKEWKPFCIKYLKTNDISVPTVINKKCNYNIVFTGVRDTDLKNIIELNGGKVTDTISKLTTYLVVKDKSSTTSKMEIAKEYGIKIVLVDEMKDIMNKLV